MSEHEQLVRKREMFDSICCSLLTQLESFEQVSAIDFSANDPAQVMEVQLWEKKNMPYKLPEDLKAFLHIFNGVHVSWKVQVGKRQVSVGELNVHRLDLISRCTLEGSVFQSLSGSPRLPDPKSSAVFTLESCSDGGGQVVLLYRQPSGPGGSEASSSSPSNPPNVVLMEEGGGAKENYSYANPQVWFQDPSTHWHYVCSSFTEYMRLSVAHFGIIGWQAAFSPEGLRTSTAHWMGLVCPERLCVDRSYHASELAEVSKAAAAAAAAAAATATATATATTALQT